MPDVWGAAPARECGAFMEQVNWGDPSRDMQIPRGMGVCAVSEGALRRVGKQTYRRGRDREFPRAMMPADFSPDEPAESIESWIIVWHVWFTPGPRPQNTLYSKQTCPRQWQKAMSQLSVELEIGVPWLQKSGRKQIHCMHCFFSFGVVFLIIEVIVHSLCQRSSDNGNPDQQPSSAKRIKSSFEYWRAGCLSNDCLTTAEVIDESSRV